jgi:chromosome segregation ATPase
MTDEELKELVGSLAIAQKKTDEQMKRTDEQMKRTDEQMKRTDEQMKRTDERMKRTDEQIADLFVFQKEVSEQMKQTDEQMRRTDEKLARTDAKLERIGVQLGNIAKNQGDVAEEFFYNSLIEDAHLGSIHFDDVAMNMQKHRGQIQEEYDLVMTNGEAVGIIEVKYKAHQNDLDKLERKMRNFKELFPWFKDYKIYGALAAFNVNEVAKKEALERGFFVLQRRGEVMQMDCAENLFVL